MVSLLTRFFLAKCLSVTDKKGNKQIVHFHTPICFLIIFFESFMKRIVAKVLNINVRLERKAECTLSRTFKQDLLEDTSVQSVAI